MAFIILSLLTAYLFILEVESQRHDRSVLISRASGRLQVATVMAYRGTGRLGCYRASERG